VDEQVTDLAEKQQMELPSWEEIQRETPDKTKQIFLQCRHQEDIPQEPARKMTAQQKCIGSDAHFGVQRVVCRPSRDDLVKSNYDHVKYRLYHITAASKAKTKPRMGSLEYQATTQWAGTAASNRSTTYLSGDVEARGYKANYDSSKPRLSSGSTGRQVISID